MKPPDDGVAVKVAQVPPMYQVPGLMMQPFGVPEVVTWRVPLPEKGVPGEVVGAVVVVVVVVDEVVGEVPEEDLGRYLTPVAGQSDVAPSILMRISGIRWSKRLGVLTWISRNERARLHAPRDIVEIPDFIQLIRILALNDSSDAPRSFQRRQNSRRGIRRCGTRHDACVRQPRVRRQRLEQRDDLVEEIHHLLLRRVIRVAVRLQRADARAVFPPLVLPERFVRARVADPVGVHVGEEGSLAGGG